VNRNHSPIVDVIRYQFKLNKLQLKPLYKETNFMQPIDRPEVKKPAAKLMKRFIIREVEAIQTTRAADYGACCCNPGC
jgi:hypothetical protein